MDNLKNDFHEIPRREHREPWVGVHSQGLLGGSQRLAALGMQSQKFDNPDGIVNNAEANLFHSSDPSFNLSALVFHPHECRVPCGMAQRQIFMVIISLTQLVHNQSKHVGNNSLEAGFQPHT